MILTVTVPDECLNDMIDGFCHDFGYSTNKEVGESKTQFAKRMHRKWLRQKYIDEKERGNNATRQSIIKDATTGSEGFSVS
jgi:hypothetical protein